MRDHNLRAPEIWKILEPAIDWKGKQVVDLGCGHGDLLWRIYQAGAIFVLGIDRDPDALKAARRRLFDKRCPTFLGAHHLEDYLIRTRDRYDIALCFSTIPYIKLSLGLVLRRIRELADVSFLEIQYNDDGPGNYSKEEIRSTLEHVWDDVEILGSTLPEGRIIPRDIWRVE